MRRLWLSRSVDRCGYSIGGGGSLVMSTGARSTVLSLCRWLRSRRAARGEASSLSSCLPGGDDPDPREPIEEAVALRDAGQLQRAVDLLEGLVEWDSRCLDAHA